MKITACAKHYHQSRTKSSTNLENKTLSKEEIENNRVALCKLSAYSAFQLGKHHLALNIIQAKNVRDSLLTSKASYCQKLHYANTESLRMNLYNQLNNNKIDGFLLGRKDFPFLHMLNKFNSSSADIADKKSAEQETMEEHTVNFFENKTNDLINNRKKLKPVFNSEYFKYDENTNILSINFQIDTCYYGHKLVGSKSNLLDMLSYTEKELENIGGAECSTEEKDALLLNKSQCENLLSLIKDRISLVKDSSNYIPEFDRYSQQKLRFRINEMEIKYDLSANDPVEYKRVRDELESIALELHAKIIENKTKFQTEKMGCEIQTLIEKLNSVRKCIIECQKNIDKLSAQLSAPSNDPSSTEGQFSCRGERVKFSPDNNSPPSTSATKRSHQTAYLQGQKPLEEMTIEELSKKRDALLSRMQKLPNTCQERIDMQTTVNKINRLLPQKYTR